MPRARLDVIVMDHGSWMMAHDGYVHQVPLMGEVPLARRVMDRHVDHVDVATKWLGFLWNAGFSSSNQVRWRRVACVQHG